MRSMHNFNKNCVCETSKWRTELLKFEKRLTSFLLHCSHSLVLSVRKQLPVLFLKLKEKKGLN